MNRRPLFPPAASIVVLSLLCARALGANAAVGVDVEDPAGKTCEVDAVFDVNAPAAAWEVLTDYEGNERQHAMLPRATQ